MSQESWDLLYNTLPYKEQSFVNNMLTTYEPVNQLSTEDGIDLLNFRIFIQASTQFFEAVQYSVGKFYIGELIMGITILCDYYCCGPFPAMVAWKTGVAVPIFRHNLPYAIRLSDKDIVIGSCFDESVAASWFM